MEREGFMGESISREFIRNVGAFVGKFFTFSEFLEGLEFLSFGKRSFLPFFCKVFVGVQSLSMRSK